MKHRELVSNEEWQRRIDAVLGEYENAHDHLKRKLCRSDIMVIYSIGNVVLLEIGHLGAVWINPIALNIEIEYLSRCSQPLKRMIKVAHLHPHDFNDALHLFAGYAVRCSVEEQAFAKDQFIDYVVENDILNEDEHGHIIKKSRHTMDQVLNSLGEGGEILKSWLE